MSLRQLIEGDCGGVNPLMQLGGQFTRDAALKDEGLMRDEPMEFIGQAAGPPQSFHMGTILQEMREIEKHANGVTLQSAPRVIDEVTASGSGAQNFGQPQMPPTIAKMVNVHPQQQHTRYVQEFFDETGETTAPYINMMPLRLQEPFISVAPLFPVPEKVSATAKFFDENEKLAQQEQHETMESWMNEHDKHREEEAASDQNYHEQFWQRLQEDWQKLSEETEYPWLSEIGENYDPYKEYEFAEENPMAEIDNVFEKGKQYLKHGDIPSAVMCFEVAAKRDPGQAEIWELLGLSQAENEMDPQSIAALKRSLEIKPENPRVLMALAVCYTNESLQSHALKMLINWLEINPKYKHLVGSQEQEDPNAAEAAAAYFSSLIRGPKLTEVQNMFLEAARLNPNEIDAEVQEALGVLYNLSGEFDKAAECFHSTLQVKPNDAKLWNRLGASLANGTRSAEAVQAYQEALKLEPGFVRVRYNVGVCCMNLKAYKQAAEHLLTALNMQANTAGVVGGQTKMSESIWSTLRMVISLMGRGDLHELLNQRNLAALNEALKN